MSDKSHVSLESHVCPVCTKKHEVGILLHKHLRKVLDPETVTEWGLCPECEALNKQGYIALVGVDEKKSTFNEKGNIDPAQAYRTGQIVHMKRETFDRTFDKSAGNQPMVFADPEVLATMVKAMHPDDKARAIAEGRLPKETDP